MINYDTIKGSDLLAIYNHAAAALGRPLVKKFSDKPTGVKRTQAILEEAQKIEGFVAWVASPEGQTAAATARKSTPPPDSTILPPAKEEAKAVVVPPAPKLAARTASVPPTKKAASKAERRMDFNFKPFGKQKAPKGDNSLRTLCLAKLQTGAKFEGVVKMIEKWDADRGKGNHETIERRAYELVRIMHYQLGYGVKQEPNGTIRVYTKADAAN